MDKNYSADVKKEKQSKTAFRKGVPDNYKRIEILRYFDLNPRSCEDDFNTLISKVFSEDFISQY